MGVPSDIVPTWIPDGYVFEKVEVDENPIQHNYIALYRNDERLLTIAVYAYNMSDSQNIEIDENLIDTYIVAGTEYYIMSNNQQVRAVWIKGYYECYISGDVTVGELKLMIDSIPKG